MGFSYNARTGRLCCDGCPSFTGVRKRPCPSKYCPAIALCKECWKGKPGKASKRYHIEARCKEKHEAFAAHLAEEAARQATGEFIRSAALSQDDGSVKVWFRSATAEKAFLMSPEGYESFGYDALVTPADYQAKGFELKEAA